MRAEALRKIPETYSNEEARALIMDNIEIIRQWEATKDSFLPLDQLNTLKANVEQLETLSTSFRKRTTSEHSGNSSVSQKSTISLNSVIADDITIKSNKRYTVTPSNGGHEFPVVFSQKIAQMINQNRTDERVKRSLKALLLGPVRSASGASGIKKLAGHNNLFEIKTIGKKGTGNFRMGVFLYNGTYYIKGHTYKHIDRHSTFLQSLKQALLHAIESKDPAYAL